MPKIAVIRSKYYNITAFSRRCDFYVEGTAQDL